MELNNRCIQILRQTAMQKDGLLSGELLMQLGITRRILYYDMAKINDWLAAFKLGRVDASAGRMYLRTDNLREVERLLNNFSAYVFSVKERRALAILYIALSVSPVTCATLQSLLDVSNNTVLGDIRDCKALLKSFRLRIDTVGSRGYRIQGDEAAVRKLVEQQLYLLKNEYPLSLVGSLLQGSFVALTGNGSMDFRQLVKEGMEDYERSLGTWLVFSDLAFPEALIMSACIRCMTGHPWSLDLPEKDALKNTREYGAVLLMIRKLFDVGISLRIDESYYITILFLGIKNFDFNSSNAENDFIRKFSADLVDCFEQIACVSFKEKHAFIDRLCLHIRPMYYRLKYGIRINAALTGQIRTMYVSVYEFTRRALQRASSEMSSLIADDELVYLCVYMVSYLDEKNAQPKRLGQILIVCGAGVAASVLLREQLYALLGDAFEYHLFPARRAEELVLSRYDLVVTTVPFDTNADWVIHTGPILSEQSKDRAMDIVCRADRYFSVSRETEDILQIVRKSASIHNNRQLVKDLARYMIRKKEGAGGIPCAPPGLREMLRNRLVIRLSDATTLGETAQDVCALIEHAPERRERLTEMLAAHLEQRPELYEIAPGIALECCRKKTGSVELGILIFRSPLRWGRQKVDMLVVLATVDNFAHFPLLQELYRYLDDESIVLPQAEDENSVAEWFVRHMDAVDADNKV